MNKLFYTKTKSFMMKKMFPAILAILVLACSNQPESGNAKDSTATAEKKTNDNTGSSAKAGCENFLMFRQGTVILSSSYDGTGKETGKESSIVKKVYNEGNLTVSEMEMKHTDENGNNEKISQAVYKCDGKKFYVDISNFLSDSKQKSKIEAIGLDFPYNPSVGDTLPDASYSVKVSMGGKERIIKSHIKERKVEAKESISTAAGTFESYKISSVVEAEMDFSDMDKEQREIMDKVQKQMGKTRMIFWLVPDVAIIKMEYHMGDKLLMRHEITGIKK